MEDNNNIKVIIKDSIKEVHEKPAYVYDDMNYRIKDDLFLVLAQTTSNTKTFSIFFWLIKNMNSSNIVKDFSPTKIIASSHVSSKTFYRFIKDAEEADLFVVVDISPRKKMIMVNPELVYNFRKTKGKDRVELINLYNQYKINKRRSHGRSS